MCHISAWGDPHTCAHVQRTCVAANRKETKEFQISVNFVQIKAKIIKYGFKHTECRLVCVYIMLINFIVDLEMTGMDEVMFRPPHLRRKFEGVGGSEHHFIHSCHF